MYNITDLEALSQSDLKNLAKTMSLNENSDTLIYDILDKQAEDAVKNDSRKAEQSPRKRGRTKQEKAPAEKKAEKRPTTRSRPRKPTRKPRPSSPRLTTRQPSSQAPMPKLPLSLQPNVARDDPRKTQSRRPRPPMPSPNPLPRRRNKRPTRPMKPTAKRPTAKRIPAQRQRASQESRGQPGHRNQPRAKARATTRGKTDRAEI